jgi:hypothetical protein
MVVFDTLGWKATPFLLTKIAFKPPIIDQLAREAGIDPAALDLLKKLGITSVAELTSRLGIIEPPPEPPSQPDAEPEPAPPSGCDVYGNAADLYGDDMPDIPPGTPDPEGGDGIGAGGTSGGGQGRSGTGGASSSGGHGASGGGQSSDRGGSGSGTGSGTQGKRSPGSAGGRPFISYVGTHPNEDDPDPDRCL